jgi:anti-sigma B factor antagonist
MKLKEEKIGHVLVVRLEDPRLDSAIAAEVKTEILRLMDRQELKNILLDLAKVDYADSSGLGALLFGHRHAMSKRGLLKLLHVNTKVMTLMKIAKLDNILEWYDDEQEALDSFNTPHAEAD